MLTKQDFDQFEKILDKKLEDKLEEKLAHLPNKEEFYESQEKLMKELQGHREERAAMKHRFQDHETRISTLEQFHPTTAV
ncbi:hypothetical protein ACFLZP_05080 [Patescibacteria group bacterium]